MRASGPSLNSAPQAMAEGSWELSRPQENWGLGTPCPLCFALSGCWSAGCGQHVHGDLYMGSGAGQAGHCTGAAGCGEQTSRCPLLGCCFACPHGALTKTQGCKRV